MIRTRALHRKLLLTTLLLGVSLDAALAQDATAVAERLKATLTDQGGMTLAWSNVTGGGAQVTLEGVTMTAAGMAQPLQIGTVTLDGVAEENGGYKIGKVSLPTYAVSEGGMDISVDGVVLTNLTLPAEGAAASADPLGSMMMYEGADVASMAVKMGDKSAFTLDQLHIAITRPVDGKPMEFEGAAEKFSADLSTIQDAEAQAVLNELGYQSINGYLEMAGSWQPSDGRMSLSQYDISIDKVGTLGMTFDLGGYTLEFMKSMQEMQKSMAAGGGDQSAQGLAMLGLMQQLTFHSASIRFDDDTLTGKTLDLVAKRQRVKPTDVANQAKAILPFLMAQLNNPELTASVSAAVSKFLDDPKSIEILGRAGSAGAVRGADGRRHVDAAGPAEDARRHGDGERRRIIARRATRRTARRRRRAVFVRRFAARSPSRSRRIATAPDSSCSSVKVETAGRPGSPPPACRASSGTCTRPAIAGSAPRQSRVRVR